MNHKDFTFYDKAPYPPVRVAGPNPRYAQAMLSNIGASNSEMSAVSLYFYNSLITDRNFSEIAQCFHRIGIVEMHHMDIFGHLAFLLGEDPRLWSRSNGKLSYWTPGYNQYPRAILPLLNNALSGENEAIEKYRKQTQWIQDPDIKANLERIILDEEQHVKVFQSLIAEIGRK